MGKPPMFPVELFPLCMTSVRQTVWRRMSRLESNLIPLAALGAVEEDDPMPDLPLAYVPRTPGAPTFREMIERAVNWGRR